VGENRFQEEFIEAIYALWLFFCHLLVAAGVLVGVWAVDNVIRMLWPGAEPTMFGKIPLRMIVETADGGILIVFFSLGLFRAANSIRSRL
jgi:hypothetical protein